MMGLSGSGKSTLLRAANRLNPVTRGQVLVADPQRPDRRRALQRRGPPAHPARARRDGVPAVRPAALAHGRGERRTRPGAARRDAGGARSASSAEQLELVGLSQWADRSVGELSGGMQQRVGLARAFATNADILLMDEPFSALDPLIRDKLQDELLALQARVKKTILFVSHDLDEALRLGDRISIMRHGRIVQTGVAQDIVLRPADDYVAEFVRRMNPLKVLTGAMVMRTRELMDRADGGALPRCRAPLSPPARRGRRGDGAFPGRRRAPAARRGGRRGLPGGRALRRRSAGLDHAAGPHPPAAPDRPPGAARGRRAGARRCRRHRDHRRPGGAQPWSKSTHEQHSRRPTRRHVRAKLAARDGGGSSTCRAIAARAASPREHARGLHPRARVSASRRSSSTAASPRTASWW